MSRWVDADALIDDLEHDIAIDEDILNYVGTEGIQRTTTQFDKDCKQNAIELLLRQPSIDLVRCGECVRANHELSGVYCGMSDALMGANGFCSLGKRKEGE